MNDIVDEKRSRFNVFSGPIPLFTHGPKKCSSASFVTPEPLAPLLNGLKRAFDTSHHADLTIVCQGRRWKAHKVVLCAQSEWFMKSCAKSWKEGQEGEITFKNDEPAVIEATLHWFYEFDYGTSQDIKWPLVLDVQVYAVAEKYSLPNLKRLAATKFEQRAEKEWQSVDFAQAIVEVYGGVLKIDDALRPKITRIVNKHRVELFHPVHGSKKFSSMSVTIPQLARDVLAASCVMEHGDEWAKAVAPDGPGHGGLNMSRNRAYTFTAQCHAMPDPGGRDQQIFGEDT
ncbi:hypothetical protein KC356_g8823 [Hortaea werneckii]|nr:hypothetical protein KC356_g8823 [Hortaea werneckii]KAI7458253.1 hypothetical protein KC357_g9278 [Hortaea werneckii]KAI7552171.1 hypothetical protein KC331_g2071 [Hortaea werneckii]KAI7720991.1 hypothetical protein KC353_g1739 [Hortaea werneckii]